MKTQGRREESEERLRARTGRANQPAEQGILHGGNEENGADRLGPKEAEKRAPVGINSEQTQT